MTSRGRLEAVWMEFRAMKIFTKQPFFWNLHESRGEPEGCIRFSLGLVAITKTARRSLVQAENLAPKSLLNPYGKSSIYNICTIRSGVHRMCPKMPHPPPGLGFLLSWHRQAPFPELHVLALPDWSPSYKKGGWSQDCRKVSSCWLPDHSSKFFGLLQTGRASMWFACTYEYVVFFQWVIILNGKGEYVSSFTGIGADSETLCKVFWGSITYLCGMPIHDMR